MRKAMLTLVLSLIVCLAANAQEYKLQRIVVGSGGFVGANVGSYKVSGIFGQLAIGTDSTTSITGGIHTIYNGFWVPDEQDGGGIEERITDRGIANYPNPAQNYTNFSFNLETGAYVTLRVYDLVGSVVADVMEGYLDGGDHTYSWNNLRNTNGEDIASGTYMYELIVNTIGASGNNTNNYSLRNLLMISK